MKILLAQYPAHPFVDSDHCFTSSPSALCDSHSSPTHVANPPTYRQPPKTVNVACKLGSTPLSLAVMQDQINQVKILLEAGADVAVRTIEALR